VSGPRQPRADGPSATGQMGRLVKQETSTKATGETRKELKCLTESFRQKGRRYVEYVATEREIILASPNGKQYKGTVMCSNTYPLCFSNKKAHIIHQ
jgi:hypothetical protein